MRRRRLAPALLVTGVLAVAALAVLAADDPHSGTFNVGCSKSAGAQFCHADHTAAGLQALLPTAGGNANLCRSCHTASSGLAQRFPMETMSPADVVTNTGSSHAWNVPSTNANAGAGAPTNPQMLVRLDPPYTGSITCSTCHNQHLNAPSAVTTGTAGTQWTGTVTHTQGTGTGTVSLSYTATASPKGYLVEIVETGGAAGTAKFRLSNDGGVSWWGYSAGAWVAYAAGNARLTSTSPIALNDGANATVTFAGATAGSFVLAPTPDRFRSYVSYAFLRAPLDTGTNAAGNRFCRDCHSTWAMDHTAVHTYDGTMKQHPVGITLNANGGNYDRTSVLDGNGALQSVGDGNPSNDLKLAPDGTIQCYTCHGTHHSPGNTSAQFTP